MHNQCMTPTWYRPHSTLWDVRHWSGEDDDLLGALQLTFNKEKLRSIFPRWIEDCPPVEGSELRQFAFNQDYISHLASVMTLSCDMLNEFLRAAGSKWTLSYGSSKYYDGQTFKEVLYREWPAQTIALTQHGWSAILCWFFGWIMVDSWQLPQQYPSIL